MSKYNPEKLRRLADVLILDKQCVCILGLHMGLSPSTPLHHKEKNRIETMIVY